MDFTVVDEGDVYRVVVLVAGDVAGVVPDGDVEDGLGVVVELAVGSERIQG